MRIIDRKTFSNLDPDIKKSFLTFHVVPETLNFLVFENGDATLLNQFKVELSDRELSQSFIDEFVNSHAPHEGRPIKVEVKQEKVEEVKQKDNRAEIYKEKLLKMKVNKDLKEIVNYLLDKP